MWPMVPQPLEDEAAFIKQSDSHDQRVGSTFRRTRSLHITCAGQILGACFLNHAYPDTFLPGIELDFLVEAAARIYREECGTFWV